MLKKSVAVLYFENQGGGKEDEYFRDGMTEDIITELSKIAQLQIYRARRCWHFATNRQTRRRWGSSSAPRLCWKAPSPRRQSPPDYRSVGGSGDQALGVGGALRPADGRCFRDSR